MIHEGYLTMVGMLVVFLFLFGFGVSLIVHGIFHYVNEEFQKYCIWCWIARWLSSNV